MDYEKIIHALIDDIIAEPESVLVRATESDNGKSVVILVACEKEDTARLIGRHGIIANALREVIGVVGKNQNKHIHLRFESFGDESKED